MLYFTRVCIFFLGGGPSVETVALVAQFSWGMIDGNKNRKPQQNLIYF